MRLLSDPVFVALIKNVQFICGDMNSEEPIENYNMAIVEFASIQL